MVRIYQTKNSKRIPTDPTNSIYRIKKYKEKAYDENPKRMEKKIRITNAHTNDPKRDQRWHQRTANAK